MTRIALTVALGLLAGHVITTASANVAHWHIHGGSYE
jgi:hypothetical protein